MVGKRSEILCECARHKMNKRRSEVRGCTHAAPKANYNSRVWRGGRVAEGARLESVCASNGTAGSNPVLSAREKAAKACASLQLSFSLKSRVRARFGGAEKETRARTCHFSCGGAKRYPVLSAKKRNDTCCAIFFGN